MPAARRHRAARPASAAQHRCDHCRRPDPPHLVDRWGEEFDLWQLPTLSIGLSREHDWAAGTLSLSVAGFCGYLRDLARDLVCSLPARNLAIVNGHGGNRGILENLLRELQSEFGVNACVLHPFDLAGGDPAGSDVHGGKR